MKPTRAVGRVIKPFVNFPRWMGLRLIMSNGSAIVKMVQDMRIRPPAVRKETFEEAVARLNLSEEEIKSRMRHCLILSIIYSVAALILLVYTIYMVIHGHLGMILGILLTVLIAVFAYREHFWYFQMKTRMLGRTFKEWLIFLFRGARK